MPKIQWICDWRLDSFFFLNNRLRLQLANGGQLIGQLEITHDYQSLHKLQFFDRLNLLIKFFFKYWAIFNRNLRSLKLFLDFQKIFKKKRKSDASEFQSNVIHCS